MELKQSSKGDITLEMLQREYAKVRPLEPKIVTIYCKPNEVPEVRALMEKIFGKEVCEVTCVNS